MHVRIRTEKWMAVTEHVHANYAYKRNVQQKNQNITDHAHTNSHTWLRKPLLVLLLRQAAAAASSTGPFREHLGQLSPRYTIGMLGRPLLFMGAEIGSWEAGWTMNTETSPKTWKLEEEFPYFKELGIFAFHFNIAGVI